MILVENRQLIFSNREEYLGTAYDNQSASRVFRIPRINYDGIDLAPLKFWIDMVYMDDGSEDTQRLDPVIEEDALFLTWTIGEITMSHRGTIKINLRARDSQGVVRWSSFQAVVYSEDTASPPEISGGGLSELERLEESIEANRKAFAAEEEKRQTAETGRVAAEAEREAAETSRQQGFTSTMQEFEETKDELRGFAVKAESYAHGGTGSRKGEDADNAEYYSAVAKTEADRASQQAELLEQYAVVMAPEFYFNADDGCLYEKGGFGVEFYVNEGTLYVRLTAGGGGGGGSGGGAALPAGGAPGDVLTKKTASYGDTYWAEDSQNMTEMTEEELNQLLEGE